MCDIDVASNTLYVCFGTDHPALFTEHFHTEKPYWIDQVPDELSNRSKDQVQCPQYVQMQSLHTYAVACFLITLGYQINVPDVN